MPRTLAFLLALTFAGPVSASVLEIRTDRGVTMELDGREIYNPHHGRDVDVRVEPGTYNLKLLDWRRRTIEEAQIEVLHGHAVRIGWRRRELSIESAPIPEPPQQSRGARAARGVLGAAATAGAIVEAGGAARDGISDVQGAAERGESGHTRTEISIGSGGVTSETQTAVARQDGSVDMSRTATSASTGPGGVSYDRQRSDAQVEMGPQGVRVDESHSQTGVAIGDPGARSARARADTEQPAGRRAPGQGAAPAAASAPETVEVATPPAPAQPVNVHLRRRGGPPILIAIGDDEPLSLTAVRVVSLTPGTYPVSVRDTHGDTERFSGTLVVTASGGIIEIGTDGATAQGGARWER